MSDGWTSDPGGLTQTFARAGYRPAVDLARVAGLAADCANVPCEIAVVPPASVRVRVPTDHPLHAVACAAIERVAERGPLMWSPPDGPATCTITPFALDAIRKHGREGYPFEVCGLLIGASREPWDGSTVDITEAARARNLNTDRANDRYDLDPADYMRIEKDATARGLSVVGVYHTHPNAPGIASSTDREAAWEGFAYLIQPMPAPRPDGSEPWPQVWVLRTRGDATGFDEAPLALT
jgi:proteasome lid subunit RPN8/RPN11